jgi:hypothetical protein
MPQNELKRKAWPARDRRKLLIFCVVVSVFLGLVLWTSGLFWTLVSALILFVSLSSFFLPTTYRLNEEGVAIRKPFYRITRDWETVRRVTADKNGIFLSPFKKRTRMENYRGVFLISKENADQVLAFIRERVEEGTPIEDARKGTPEPKEG